MNTTMIELIREHLTLSRQYYPNESEFKPAWKFAYYLPAKKDKNGDVVLSSIPWTTIPIYFLAVFLTILFLITGVYILLILPAALIAFGIYYSIYLFKPISLIINQTGITFQNQNYHWKDYVAAWICVTNHRRPHYTSLILIKPDGNYTFLNLSLIALPYQIGTAIRDFQPENYKILPTFAA